MDSIEKLPEVINLRKRTHVLQHFFTSNKVWNRYVSFIKDRYEKTPRKLPGLCPTRWWSELILNKVLIDDFNYHREFLALYDTRVKMNLILNGHEMILLKTITLEPLEELTAAMSGENYVTASALLPVVYRIEKTIKKAEEAQTTRATQVAHEAADIVYQNPEMLKYVVQKLQKRYFSDSLLNVSLNAEGHGDASN